MQIRIGFVSNSSSESFIIKSDRFSICQVLQMAVDLLAVWNKNFASRYTFYDVFDEPYISDGKEHWLTIYNHMYDAEGNIILNSASDNTIPYPIMVWFDVIGERIHRG